MANEDISPPSALTLHRMVWHPDCYDQGELTSSGAFPSQDLNGTRFISVDREDLFDQESLILRAKAQQSKADGQRTIRSEARVVDLPCGAVRETLDASGDRPFMVTSEPEPDNPAHCGIWNVSGKNSRSYIHQIRARLMQLRTKEWTLRF